MKFLPRGSFAPLQASRAPSWFVLAKAELEDNVLTEKYVSNEGNTAEVKYKSGAWVSSSVSCNVLASQLPAAVFGLALFAIGGIIRSLRTGEWNSILSWRRTPFKGREAVLMLYGGAIFVATLLAPQGTCSL